jgi:peptidoglycan/LPS O-acetylase OafA/YrhL
MRSAAGRLPLLDSLRALTTLAILFAHTCGPSGVHANSTLRPYSTRFEFTIALFMMLSAFLIYRPYVRSRLDDRPPPSTRVYARNRFLRVVPAYWIALTITALWITTSGVGVFTARGVPTYYGFAQVYSGDTILGGIAIAWFLCILVAFYVLVPFYAALMRRVGGGDRTARFRAELWGCAALLGVGIAYRAAVEYAGLRSEYAVSYFVPAYFDWLAPGMALAVLSVWYGKRWTSEVPQTPDEGPLPAPLRLLQRVPSLGLLAALAGFWFVSTRIGLTGPYPDPGDHLQYFAEHWLNLFIALCVLATFAIGSPEQGLTRRLLNNRVLLFLSVISYGILLYHLAVIEQLKSWGFSPPSGVVSYVAWPVVTLAAAVVFGFLTNVLIERPLGRIDGIGRSRRPAPAKPPAAVATVD